MRTPVIAIYSDNQIVRQTLIGALGTQLATDLAPHKVIEFATGPALRLFLDQKGKIDLFILDGEATPEGGMGIARQLKDEIHNCPPTLVITGRAQDAWLFVVHGRCNGCSSHRSIHDSGQSGRPTAPCAASRCSYCLTNVRIFVGADQ